MFRKLTLTLLLLGAAMLPTAALYAEDATKTAKQPPSDAAVIDVCGDSLSHMFAVCGEPGKIYVDSSKQAIAHYGDFAFQVNQKTVPALFIFPRWKGTIKGCKFGDSMEQAFKVLGKQSVHSQGKGFDAYGWQLTKPNRTFWLYFTDDKIDQVQVTLDDTK